MVEAVEANFGTSAEFTAPKGGIFLWIKLPDEVDTQKLFQAAAAEGVAINPGPEWSSEAAPARSSLRLCFANPSAETIREGVAKLAEICNREFGVPTRIANVGAD
jgi:2-aminoadipate transaminase